MEMPSVCHMFGISPREYWDTPIDELQLLIAYRDAWHEAQKR